jgi:hypothetical protein
MASELRKILNEKKKIATLFPTRRTFQPEGEVTVEG